MELKHCVECGSLFASYGSFICPLCIMREENQLYIVRDYLKKNPTITSQILADDTKVPLKTIYKFVKEGKLASNRYTGLYYECGWCGAPIKEGKWCPNCMVKVTKIQQQLQQALRRNGKLKDKE